MASSFKFARKENTLQPRKSVLIVCEGAKTEPAYFEAFRLPQVVEVQGVGKNTVSLVKHALDLKAKSNFDEVWCVFDRDSFPPDNISSAFALAKANNIEVIFSNECFELWYLLHFIYFDTGVSRKRYMSMLNQQLGHNYKKNDPAMYDLLLEKQGTAIKFSKKLHKLFPFNPGTEHKAKPSTNVYKLVERLNKLLKKYNL